ncbi:GNAT family N-acetyltransferase [Risungbinella massiliensis]|uniref:GNAT family N-acetyltransferase n=1 Tax=Risungbinella massiliensis TaxID=1329796 RepID=UPI0005CC4795|nr:GNAT family N-acetyltransferase [Risungbinella massiliensis]
MQLRSFRLSDVHDVMNIWHLNAEQESEKETLAGMSEQLMRDPQLVVVAESDEGAVVGAIVGSVDGESGFYYCLAVHPDYQHKKVGSQLVNALEERLRERGATQLFVTVDDGTKKLTPFYKKMGIKGYTSAKNEKDLIISNCSF